MDNKTALIVDDSRTAAQVLLLMLQREAFHVDTVDHGDAALKYLRDNMPGIIFMDHLMPGMDGFETVKEIKANPRTAAIPIVMYTSQASGIYVGQAHALGAVDVLPKPPKRELLVDIFRRIAAQAEAEREAVSPAPVTEAAAPAAPADAEGAPTVADSIRTTKQPAAPAPTSQGPAPDYLRQVTADVEVEPPPQRAPWWLVALLVAAAFGAGTQYPRLAASKGSDLELLPWALNQTLVVTYGETHFGGDRVELVRGLVEQLAAREFTGTVRLEGHAGQFCQHASATGWSLAERDALIDACEVRGFLNLRASRAASQAQSQEFRSMLAGLGTAAPGIRVEVVGIGDDNPRVAYPAPEQVKTAGEWNAVAARNNRITMRLVPAN